jgi:hypothetical protein
MFFFKFRGESETEPEKIIIGDIKNVISPVHLKYFIDMRTQRDQACARMKFHKHMHDMRDLLRFKAYFQFNVTF